MASPIVPYLTYRISNIPRPVTKETLKHFIESRIRNRIAFLSLSYDELNESCTSVITLDSNATDDSESRRSFLEAFRSPILSRAEKLLVSLPALQSLPWEDLQGSGEDPKISVDDDFEGLTILADPGQGQNIIDVIAVTGLGGKAFASWQSNEGSMWLRDFLPKDIKNFRMFTYGYPSTVFRSKSFAGITEYTRGFLQSFLGSQSIYVKGERRPLILIGHSLGCLMIKKALVMSTESQDFKCLAPLVYSVVFFGAPHRGLQTTALEAIVQGEPTEELIRDLKPGSKYLAELNDKFKSLTKKLKIIACFELEQTPTAIKGEDGTLSRTGPLALMVPEDSACLDVECEYKISINKNHSMIAKLSRKQGSPYHKLKDKLLKHAEEAHGAIKARFFPSDCTGKMDTILEIAASVQKHCFQEINNEEHDETHSGLSMTRASQRLALAIMAIQAFRDSLQQDNLFPVLCRHGTMSTYSEAFLSAVNKLYDYYIPLKAQTERWFSGMKESVLTNSGLIRLVYQTRGSVQTMRNAVTFALLGTNGFELIEQFLKSSAADAPGLRTVARSQLIGRKINTGETENIVPLRGILRESRVKVKNLRFMEFQAENTEQMAEVVVEYRAWKPVSDSVEGSDRNYTARTKEADLAVKEKIKQLTVILRTISGVTRDRISDEERLKEPVNVLKCLGHLEEPNKARIVLVFLPPPLHPKATNLNILSLDDTLELESGRDRSHQLMPLETRFRLAYQISSAVLSIHGCGWIHKDLRSQNIILVPIPDADPMNSAHEEEEPAAESQTSERSWQLRPYLKGFDFARQTESMSSNHETNNLVHNWYRHPDRQGTPNSSCSKIHDLYALGVILFEIGFATPIKCKFNQQIKAYEHKGEFPPRPETKNALLASTNRGMPRAMGTKYAKVVRTCLTGEFGVTKDDQEQTELGMSCHKRILEPISEGLSL